MSYQTANLTKATIIAKIQEIENIVGTVRTQRRDGWNSLTKGYTYIKIFESQISELLILAQQIKDESSKL